MSAIDGGSSEGKAPIEFRGCDWEPEIVRAIAEGRAERIEDDLREHVAHCGPCKDLIEAGAALACDREWAVREAAVPSSGAVWWRMQIRRRSEAQQAARRTVNFVQGAILVACSLTALVVLGWGSAQYGWLQPMISPTNGAGGVSTHTGSWSGWFVVALAAWLVSLLGAVRWGLADDGFAGAPARTRAAWRRVSRT